MIAAVVAALTDPLLGVLSGIASTATIFDLTGWWALWPIDAESTNRHARRDEFEPRLEEVVIVAWALAGLLTVALLLLLGKTEERPLVALLALAGVAMSGRAASHVRRPLCLSVLLGRARGSISTARRPARISCASATTSG